MQDARAIELTITWDDGLKHVFTRDPEGTWHLQLEGAPPPPVIITGYTQEAMDRVLSKALEGTPDPRIDPSDAVTPELESGSRG